MVIVEVPRPGHQRTEECSAGEECRRIGIPFQPHAGFPHAREVIEQRLDLTSPFVIRAPEALGVCPCRGCRRRSRGTVPLCSQLLQSRNQRLRLPSAVLQLTGSFHRRLHGIALTDQVHHPRLGLQRSQDLLRRIVAHIPQLMCQVPHLVVPVALLWHCAAQQLPDDLRQRNPMIV